MPTLILNGSPRMHGNTHILLEKVLEGIRAAGDDATLIHLAGLQLAPCSSCGFCEKTGQCSIHDAMDELYQQVGEARHLVVGSPIYFYGVSAQTKAFIDRCQVFWSRKYRLAQVRKTVPQRYGHFVSVAATSGSKCFDGAHLTLRYTFDVMDRMLDTEILVQGVDERGAVHKKPAALQAAFALGQRIGTDVESDRQGAGEQPRAGKALDKTQRIA